MSFGQPYLDPDGRIPHTVRSYLLPQERQTIIVHFHPAILIWPVLAVVAACAAGSTVTVFTDIGGTILVAVWGVPAIACLLLAVRVWTWLEGYLVVTRHRVILIPGIIKHKMVSIPAREIRDISLSRTLPGRLAGYGLLTLTPVSEGHAMPVINYIPYPDQLYLEVRGLYFSEGCGSFEVSWLRCEDVGLAVFGVVDAFVLAAEVVAPVVLEVAVAIRARSFRMASAPSRRISRLWCPFCLSRCACRRPR
jgi:Bacterial PH domain